MYKTYRVLTSFEGYPRGAWISTSPTERLEALVAVGYLEVEKEFEDPGLELASQAVDAHLDEQAQSSDLPMEPVSNIRRTRRT